MVVVTMTCEDGGVGGSSMVVVTMTCEDGGF
jgi:hypothetical protein